MSQVLEGVLRRVQLDPSVSRQAALLHQRKLLTDMEFLNDASSSVLASNSNHLADCEVKCRFETVPVDQEAAGGVFSSPCVLVGWQGDTSQRQLALTSFTNLGHCEFARTVAEAKLLTKTKDLFCRNNLPLIVCRP